MLDKMKSEGIRKVLNKGLNGRYGKVETLELQSKEKRLNLSLLMNGESETISVEIGEYIIDDSNPEKPAIEVRDLKVSRQWMQELATDQLEGQRFDIPAKFTKVIKMVL